MKELNQAQTEEVTGALRLKFTWPIFKKPIKKPPITTLAVGEEGGPIITTLALGEEGGGVATTLAIGEEDGGTAVSAEGTSALGSF